jgi:hypothetical protein
MTISEERLEAVEDWVHRIGPSAYYKEVVLELIRYYREDKRLHSVPGSASAEPIGEIKQW